MSKLIHKEWIQRYQMGPYPLISFAASKAPNGLDIWLTGGLSNPLFSHVIVYRKTNIIK